MALPWAAPSLMPPPTSPAPLFIRRRPGTALNSGSTTLTVVFTPSDTVDYSSATDTVNLVVSPAPLTVTAASTNRLYGQSNPVFTGTLVGVVNSDNITATYSCSATSGSPTGPYPIMPALLDPDNRQTNYTVSLVNGTLTVEPVTLMVTWANPASIIYGASLTTNQLNAIANVPGSFVYTPTNGAVLNTGTNTLTTVFSPNDTVDYTNATNTVELVVSPATLTVTAASTNRVYGQPNPAFTGTVEGVTNGDNIIATYTSSATNGSIVGMFAIVPTLVDPGDRETNYTVNLVNGTLTVTQAVPSITWTNPPPIAYGASLATNQLNASANVPGIFSYMPTNGTTLNTGTNILFAIFTPGDAVDYSNTTNAVDQIVLPAPLSVVAASTNRLYGQSNPVFMGTLVGVTNGDNITAAFNCSATAASVVGTYPIMPSLVDPDNRLTNYAVNLTNGTLTVVQAPGVIAWSNPPVIIYGAPLTSNQLNATANAPGAFDYHSNQWLRS